LGEVANICNPSIQEVNSGESQVQDQAKLHSETLPQKAKQNKTKMKKIKTKEKTNIL
jgi:hypothetical protein